MATPQQFPPRAPRPKPTPQPQAAPAQPTVHLLKRADQAREQGKRARQQARARKANVNKTTHFGGGGINPNFAPSLSITVNKGGAGAQAGPGAAAAGAKGIPGSDFNSNEDIRAFCEHLRKAARQKAVELALDAEHLEAVLRHIPDSTGSMVGARMRARRVSRHLKTSAAAYRRIAKAAASTYAQFEREYEANLRQVGRARAQQQPVRAFQFG